MYIPTIYPSKKGLFASIFNDTVNYYYLLQKIHVQKLGGGRGGGGSGQYLTHVWNRVFAGDLALVSSPEKNDLMLTDDQVR